MGRFKLTSIGRADAGDQEAAVLQNLDPTRETHLTTYGTEEIIDVYIDEYYIYILHRYNIWPL